MCRCVDPVLYSIPQTKPLCIIKKQKILIENHTVPVELAFPVNDLYRLIRALNKIIHHVTDVVQETMYTQYER